jgi:hypothetical protein
MAVRAAPTKTTSRVMLLSFKGWGDQKLLAR